jgi:superfamily II DNA/RNA helicase
MLRSWQNVGAVAESAEGSEEEAEALEDRVSRSLNHDEQGLLERFIAALVANQESDPKYAVVLDCLRRQGWLNRGCIVFSQYYDSVRWLADQLRIDFPNERIAIYAGSRKSGIWQNGEYRSLDREEIKLQVRTGDIRLLLGTDAASEGLNLQRLGTLINLDLPWNPTRLEQRKGRIQRIGQLADTVLVYNMRYRDSVEDRVHQILSARLKDIHSLFGQVPDVLEDVWIDVALGQIESAKRIIDSVPKKHPFDIRYERIENVDWESCEEVLSDKAKRASLVRGW